VRTLEDRLVRIVAVGFVIYSVALTSLSVVLMVMPHGQALSIQHTPVKQIIVGSRLEIQAVVTGGAGDANVTLHYKPLSSTQWKVTQMQLMVKGGSTYLHEIPRNETTESVDYQICAKDGSNISLCTPTYTVAAGDFKFEAHSTPVFYPNRTSSMDVKIQSVNGFNQTIDLSISGLTIQEAKATFEPSHVTPPPSQSSIVKLSFQIEASARGGRYDLTVSGTSGAVKRSFGMTLWIPDFEFVGNPSNQTLKLGDHTAFTITLRSMYCYDNPVRISVQGIPKGMSYNLTTSELQLNGTAVLALSIETTASVRKDIYNVTVSAIGGGRLKEFTIILIVV